MGDGVEGVGSALRVADKGKGVVSDGGEVKSRRKRKEVEVGSLEVPAVKKSKNNVGAVVVGGNSPLPGSVSSQKSKGIVDLSAGVFTLPIDGKLKVVHVPKRKRGTVAVKVVDGNHDAGASGSRSSIEQVKETRDDGGLDLKTSGSGKSNGKAKQKKGDHGCDLKTSGSHSSNEQVKQKKGGGRDLKTSASRGSNEQVKQIRGDGSFDLKTSGTHSSDEQVKQQGDGGRDLKTSASRGSSEQVKSKEGFWNGVSGKSVSLGGIKFGEDRITKASRSFQQFERMKKMGNEKGNQNVGNEVSRNAGSTDFKPQGVSTSVHQFASLKDDPREILQEGSRKGGHSCSKNKSAGTIGSPLASNLVSKASRSSSSVEKMGMLKYESRKKVQNEALSRPDVRLESNASCVDLVVMLNGDSSGDVSPSACNHISMTSRSPANIDQIGKSKTVDKGFDLNEVPEIDGSAGHNIFGGSGAFKPYTSSSSIYQIDKLDKILKENHQSGVPKKNVHVDSKASFLDKMVNLSGSSKCKVVGPFASGNVYDRSKVCTSIDLNVNLNDEGREVLRNEVSGKAGSKGCDGSAVSLAVKPSGSSSYNGKVAKSKDDSQEIQEEVSRKAEPLDSNGGSIEQCVELKSNSRSKVVGPKVKRERQSDKPKGYSNRTELLEVDASHHAQKEGCNFVVNDDGSSKERRKISRKGKDKVSGNETVERKVEPSVDHSLGTSDAFQDEDEDDHLQNAARLLLSCFDPVCTGSLSKTSASSSANNLPLVGQPSQGFGSQGLIAGKESASADNKGLQPDTQKEQRIPRKRRHFYEISTRFLDPYWVLNRKIRVFWPEEESWFDGVVDGYNEEIRMHHVSYDDNDEEWISLENEKFKLLLYPAEVPGQLRERRPAVENNNADTESRDLPATDGVESRTKSEPISSWMPQSPLHARSSPCGSLKKQKVSHPPKLLQPMPSDEVEDARREGDIVLKAELSSPNSISASPAILEDKEQSHTNLTNDGNCEMSWLESMFSPDERHLPFVYVRRRFGRQLNRKINKVCVITSVPDVSPASVVHSSPSTAECNVSHGSSDLVPWSINSEGMLELNMAFIEDKEFSIEVSSPVWLENAFGKEMPRLLKELLLLHNGFLVTTWPTVHLEVLFVDNIVGLRFFLLEGSLKQAVTFLFLVLSLFSEPDKQGVCDDLQVPMTSIRVKLSCIRDLSKQHAFSFYSFSKIKNSIWLFLDSELQPHCLLTKQLSLRDCTYDNIKSLEGGSSKLSTSSAGWNPSPKVVWRKPILGVVPIGVPRGSGNVRLQRNSSSILNHGRLPPFAISFPAAPTFFLSLHLKLLMERCIASLILRYPDPVTLVDQSEYTCQSVDDDRSQVLDSHVDSHESTLETNSFTSLTRSPCLELSSSKPELVKTDVSMTKSSEPTPNADVIVSGNSNSVTSLTRTPCPELSFSKPQVINTDGSLTISSERIPNANITVSGNSNYSKVPSIAASPLVPIERCYSNSSLTVEIPSCDQVDKHIDKRTCSIHHVPDLCWYSNNGISSNPTPNGRRLHQRRVSPSSAAFRYPSHEWEVEKIDLMGTGFRGGPKKPRTQVHYALPSGGVDSSSKHIISNQSGLPFRRIRKAYEKKASESPRSSRRNLDLVACDANLLITLADRGWREHGVRVFLEQADQTEWKLSVKHCGLTKYSHKVLQDLQPGSTNRFTHAMIWKGGKDWALEFPDRSQWVLFKEMHEECQSRNIRAASKKNIPIPGVRMIEEFDDDSEEEMFVRGVNYFRQIEADVDMAMDASRVLYDMDSEDEEWVVTTRTSLETEECDYEVDELFEKAMDMFEKVAYEHQNDQLSFDQMKNHVAGVGPLEVLEKIHEYWRQKRQRKGMALIRHLQPPLWKKYEQQLRQWEKTKPTTGSSTGSQEWLKTRPPMYAFCMKPRGLVILNKGSKHRPHRKFASVSGHYNPAHVDNEGQQAFGRRSSGFSYGNERAVIPCSSPDSPEASPMLRPFTRAFPPRDGAGAGHLSLNGSRMLDINSPKIGPQIQAPPAPRKRGRPRLNPAPPNLSVQTPRQPVHAHQQKVDHTRGQMDLAEFRLRDASSAAKHARKMARLARERAHKLAYKADLAIQKAMLALMTADAVKSSHGL